MDARHGSTSTSMTQPNIETPDNLCTVDGCDHPQLTRKSGYCMRHYTQWKRTGDPVAKVKPQKKPVKAPGTCTVSGCDRPIHNGPRGLCSMHYQRWRKTGDVGPPSAVGEYQHYADEDPFDQCCNRKCKRLGIWYSTRGKAYCDQHWRDYVAKARYQERNRAAGLCQCGRETEEGKDTCEVCLEYKKMRVKHARAQGKCHCGREKRPGKETCARCAKSQNRARKLKEARRKAAGVCTRCAAEGVAPGRTACEKCLQHQRDGYHRRKDKDRGAMCKCGKWSKEPGLEMCRRCIKQEKDRRKKRIV